MTTGVLVWLVLAALSAALFFGIAAVVSFFGTRDLRYLLRGSEREPKKTRHHGDGSVGGTMNGKVTKRSGD